MGDYLDGDRNTPYFIERQGVVAEVGRTFSELTGFSTEDILYRNIGEVFKSLRIGPCSNPEGVDEEAGRFLFTKSSEIRFVYIKVVRETGGKIYVVREKPDSRLEDGFPYLNTLMDGNMTGVSIFYVPGLILLKASRMFLDFLGVQGNTPEALYGKRIYEFFTGWRNSNIRDICRTAIASGKPGSIEEYEYDRLEKGITYGNVMVTPITEGGKVRYIVIDVREVTDKVLDKRELRLLEAERAKNEALLKNIEMKDEFLSLLSHEFKTPITVINSAIQAIELLCREEMTDRLKGFLRKIKQNSLRQLRLVNNLLDITRINAGSIRINRRNMDIVFLTRAIVESVRLYSDQKDVKLLFLSALDRKIIGLDEEKYERILLNLLSNAIKFTPGGKLVTVRLSAPRGKIRIEVKDEGVGIPDDKREIIFERFGQVDSSLTRQAEGTGIGLALVKLLVGALEGSISVKSKIGRGSVFCVLLPDARVEETNAEKTIHEISDNRVVQSATIEFSDIYFN